MIQVIPEMDPEDLEKILKHLPDPTCAEVALYGNFDYSSISSQTQEIIANINVLDPGGLIFRLQDVSREKILEIYKKSEEMKKDHNRLQKRIDLHGVEWYLDNHLHIELNPWELKINYRGQEPAYISEIRKELAGTNVRLKINVND